MVNVIGLGYIGLPTALMMASHGVEVVGTDLNEELVETLKRGKTTFKENGLDELFEKAQQCGIKFTTEYQDGQKVYGTGKTTEGNIDMDTSNQTMRAQVREQLKAETEAAQVDVKTNIERIENNVARDSSDD